MGRKRVIFLFFIGLSIVAVSLFFMFGPPKLMARSGEPDFCARCHVMEAEYEAWLHAGAHRRKRCVDCHLPEDTAAHYVWKAIDGVKDMLFFYSGKVPERIELTRHGKKVLQTNCVRCHEMTVSLVDTQRKCWGCHRRIMHRSIGTIATM